MPHCEEIREILPDPPADPAIRTPRGLYLTMEEIGAIKAVQGAEVLFFGMRAAPGAQ